MRKAIKILGGVALLFMAGEASAQYGISGKFSAEGGGGIYTIYCSGPGFCGVVGNSNGDGTFYFKAADGSEWDIVWKSSDNPDGSQDEFSQGVQAVPATLTEE